MEVKIRYLSREIAKCFGSSGKTETIQVPSNTKYKDVLGVLRKKLGRQGRINERLLNTFVFICEGKALKNIKDKVLSSDCEILVGYADTGG